jgi:hypothetical protein
VFAKQSSDDNSNSGSDKDEGDKTVRATKDHNSDTKENSISNEQSGKDTSGPAVRVDNQAPPSGSVGLVPPESLTNNPADTSSHGSSSDDDHKFEHNAQDIATELSGLTPQEISEYPITDLSDKDIKMVFGFMDPSHLTKVLLYLPQQDLIKIQHRLSHHSFNETLNRLSDFDRKKVEGRLIASVT